MAIDQRDRGRGVPVLPLKSPGADVLAGLDQDALRYLNRFRRENIADCLDAVAAAGALYQAEAQRETSGAHEARMRQRAEALEQAIASYNEAVRPVTAWNRTDVEFVLRRRAVERQRGDGGG